MPRPRPPTTPPRPTGQTQEAPRVPALPLALLAVAALGFQWLYFAGIDDKKVQQARVGALAFIFAPDQLLLMWCGGNLANFSLFDRWPLVLLASVILGGALLAGRLALAALGLAPHLDRLERTVFALGVGLNLLSLYALAV